jgi:hypothetical protein
VEEHKKMGKGRGSVSGGHVGGRPAAPVGVESCRSGGSVVVGMGGVVGRAGFPPPSCPVFVGFAGVALFVLPRWVVCLRTLGRNVTAVGSTSKSD